MVSLERIKLSASQVITLGALSLSYRPVWGGKESNLPRRPYKAPAP